MLFGEVTQADLLTAVIAVAIAVVGVLGSVIVAYGQHLIRRINATDTTDATERMTKKVDSVYDQVNGSGLTGAVNRLETGVKEIKQLHHDHDAKDDHRFKRIEKHLGMPEEKPRHGR